MNHREVLERYIVRKCLSIDDQTDLILFLIENIFKVSLILQDKKILRRLDECIQQKLRDLNGKN